MKSHLLIMFHMLLSTKQVVVVLGQRIASTEPCVTAFQRVLQDPQEVDAMQNTIAMLRYSYPDEAMSKISHHAFIQMAPQALQEQIAKFVWNPPTITTLLQEINKSKPNQQDRMAVIPDVYSEIYWMRPEFDFLDDNKIHYDGILKFFGICTVRSLTYLEGPPATLVALTSHQSFTTNAGTSVFLDFNREQHYAKLNMDSFHNANDITRIMIKAAVHVIPTNQHSITTFLQIAAHRIVFFVIKSARRVFEANENAQLILMATDNFFRGLNSIHMALPLLFGVLPLAIAMVIGPLYHPGQFIPYSLILVTVFLGGRQWKGAEMALAVALWRIALLQFQSGDKTATSFIPSKSTTFLILSHIIWMTIGWFLLQNTDMAHQILLAPIPKPIMGRPP